MKAESIDTKAAVNNQESLGISSSEVIKSWHNQSKDDHIREDMAHHIQDDKEHGSLPLKTEMDARRPAFIKVDHVDKGSIHMKEEVCESEISANNQPQHQGKVACIKVHHAVEEREQVFVWIEEDKNSHQSVYVQVEYADERSSEEKTVKEEEIHFKLSGEQNADVGTCAPVHASLPRCSQGPEAGETFGCITKLQEHRLNQRRVHDKVKAADQFCSEEKVTKKEEIHFKLSGEQNADVGTCAPVHASLPRCSQGPEAGETFGCITKLQEHRLNQRRVHDKVKAADQFCSEEKVTKKEEIHFKLSEEQNADVGTCVPVHASLPRCNQRPEAEETLSSVTSLKMHHKDHVSQMLSANPESVVNLNKTYPQAYPGKKPYACTECKKSFCHLQTLKNHLRLHTGENVFHCSECGKSFSTRGQYKTHLRFHTGEKPFTCTECGRKFSQYGNLKMHMRIHTGEKPFSCLECGKSYGYLVSLKVHQKVHTGERPYSCPECVEKFRLKTHLRLHQRKHILEQPYF
ncbi:ZG57 protein, partial [Polypterus senegalus]